MIADYRAAINDTLLDQGGPVLGWPLGYGSGSGDGRVVLGAASAVADALVEVADREFCVPVLPWLDRCHPGVIVHKL